MHPHLLLVLAIAFSASPAAYAEDTIGNNNTATFGVVLNNTPWALPNITDSAKKVTVGPHIIPSAGVTITNNETSLTSLNVLLDNGGCLKLNTSDPCDTDKAMKVTAVTLTGLGDEYPLSNATASKTFATSQTGGNTSSEVKFTFAQGTATLAAGTYSGTITATSAN